MAELGEALRAWVEREHTVGTQAWRWPAVGRTIRARRGRRGRT